MSLETKHDLLDEDLHLVEEVIKKEGIDDPKDFLDLTGIGKILDQKNQALKHRRGMGLWENHDERGVEAKKNIIRHGIRTYRRRMELLKLAEGGALVA